MTRRALVLAALAGLGCAAHRAVPEGKGTTPAPAVQKGLGSLDVAVYVTPPAQEHLRMLLRANQTGRLPGKPVSPEEVLELYLGMLRRHFRSVKVFESLDGIPRTGYDLQCWLNINVIYGYVSGKTSEVHLTSFFRAPDGELVDHILHDAIKTVPYPAKSSMIREAAVEAVDYTEGKLRESVKLADYARTRRGP